MPIIRFFRRLTGLVKGARVIKSPISELSPKVMTKDLNPELPVGDRVSKKQNWISAKNKK